MKMNKHDIMRKKVSMWSREARQDMRQYITDYEQLEKDVKRYFELFEAKVMTDDEVGEYADLYSKLSKVGVLNREND
jgi:hypothetical protein